MTQDGQGEPTPKQLRCSHENFGAQFNVCRLVDDKTGAVTSFLAEATVWCAECGLPFHFKGLPCGMDMDGAMVSANALEGRFALGPGIDGIIERIETRKLAKSRN